MEDNTNNLGDETIINSNPNYRERGTILEDFNVANGSGNQIDAVFYTLALEVLLDIRDNTEKPELSQKSMADKIKEMKDVTSGLGGLFEMAKQAEAHQKKKPF